MGWGFMQGLGQGLQDISKLPQQYYENSRQAKLDESVLKMQALQQALAQQNLDFNTQDNPLRLKHEQAGIDSDVAATDASKTAMAAAIAKAIGDAKGVVDPSSRASLEAGHLGGMITSDNRIAEDPYRSQFEQATLGHLNAESSAARAQASEAGPRNDYYRALAEQARSHGDLYDTQSAAGGFRPGTGAGGSHSTASAVMNYAKSLEADYLKNDPTYKFDFDPTSRAATEARAHQKAVQRAMQMQEWTTGVPLTPEQKAAISQLDAISGALGGPGGQGAGSGIAPLPR